MRALLLLLLVPAAAIVSLGLVPAAPDYDPWAYLTWGREIAGGGLDTREGPAFKPLPVAVATLLAPLGGAAPDAWLVAVRAAALAGVALAAVLAADLAGGTAGRGRARAPRPPLPLVAGLAAAVGMLLTGGLLRHAAVGNAEALLPALALGAWHRHRAGRRGQALALGLAAALVRVEVWPFLAVYVLWLTRGRPPQRLVLAAAAGAAVAAAWLLPELASSGELLRSGDRALVPNPGAPALAERPLLASLATAAALLPWPLAAAALAAPRGAARAPASAGAAWCLLVAVMAEGGFSGEPRYALAGVALISVSAGAGLARMAAALGPARAASLGAPAAAALLAGTVAFGAPDLRPLPGRLADAQRLAADLRTAVARAGGRDALLRCGPPAVGRYRSTLAAYVLDVPKRRVRADGRAGPVTLRSRLTPGVAVSPPRPAGGRLLSRAGRWTVHVRCVSGDGRSAAPAR